MGQYILHKDGAYNIYGTIADAPYFSEACTKEQLENWIKREYGNKGLSELSDRLERAHAKGTSAIFDKSLKETISCNRAGIGEKRLSYKSFIAQFLTLPEPPLPYQPHD